MVVALVKSEIAVDMLRDCLGGNGAIIPGKHFREELTKEGLTITDAWHVLAGSFTKYLNRTLKQENGNIEPRDTHRMELGYALCSASRR